MASLALILVEGVGQYMESSRIEIKSVRPYYDVFLVPLCMYSIFELTSFLLLLNLILTWHGFNHDHEGGSPTVRLLHCTTVVADLYDYSKCG